MRSLVWYLHEEPEPLQMTTLSLSTAVTTTNLNKLWDCIVVMYFGIRETLWLFCVYEDFSGVESLYNRVMNLLVTCLISTCNFLTS